MTVRLASIAAKGGVGKSSLWANLASIWAEQQRRVLIVDLDPQSNQAEVSFAVEHDDGRGLYEAASAGDAALVTPAEVRENIWLVASGSYTGRLADDIVIAAWHKARREGASRHEPRHKMEVCRHVTDVLYEIGTGFDIVLIDTPPAYENILGIVGLSAADAFVIPTRAGRGARNGLAKLSASYVAYGVETPMLGVVLLAVNAASGAVIRGEMAALAGIFGDEEPPLLGVIRDAERATYDQEEHGLSISEYREAARTLKRRGGHRFATNVEALYGDYLALAANIDAALTGIEHSTANDRGVAS